MTSAKINQAEKALARFLNKLPTDIAHSFDQHQRQAMMMALTISPSPRKKVDLRRSFSLLGRKYYFVVLFGKDRRTHKRVRVNQLQERDMGIRRYLSMGLAGSLVSMVLLSTTYLAISAMNINLLPESHAENVLFDPKANTENR